MKHTEQGSSDAPVPVGEEGGSAGPLRPSASYCEANSAGDQAENQLEATGTGELADVSIMTETEIFGKKPRVGLSPIRSRAATWGQNVRGTVAQIEGEMGKKRKLAEDSPPKTLELEPLETKFTSKLKHKIEELNKFVKGNKNVHKEIKVWACELTSLIKYASEEQRHTISTTSEAMDKASSQIKEQGNIIKQMEEDLARMKSEQAKQQEEIRKLKNLNKSVDEANAKFAAEEIWQQIRQVGGEQDVKEAINLEWPRNAYRSKIKEGNPLVENKADLAIEVFEGEEDMTKGLAKMFRERFPELIETEDDRGLSQIVVQTKVFQAGKWVSKERHIFKLMLSNKAVNEWELLLKMKRLRIGLENQNRKKIAIPIIDKSTWSTFRKVVEMAFIDSEIEVIIFIPKNEQTNTRTEKKEVDNEQNTLDEGIGHTLKSRSKYKNEAIILSPEENKSYKDILKTIRDTAELIDKSEDIKTIRKTKLGNVILELEKGVKAEEFTSILETKIEGSKIRTSGHKSETTILEISNMDSLTTEEEIRKTLTEKINNSEIGSKMDIRIKETANGTLIATIGAENETATKIKGIGKLKIGAVECPIKERSKIDRCYKCWAIGHTARQCKGPDRSKLCRNCTKENHIAAKCDKISYCAECEKEGHRTYSAICPKAKRYKGKTPRRTSWRDGA